MEHLYETYPLGGAVPNLRGYSLPAAMRMAFHLSGKPEDEIAAAMSWNKSTANRIFHNQDYWPSLPTLPKLCCVLGNAVIPRWIIDNADFLIDKAHPMQAPELFRDLRKMMAETARLIEEGEKALEDGRIVSQEARRILRALAEVFQVGGMMIAGLQAVIQDHKGEI